MRYTIAAAVSLSAALILGAAASKPARGDYSPGAAAPLVIGHRGAPGYRPDHTLASYELAIEMGADCIEPDLVMTKDGELIARHEPEIGGTTDVAQKFPERKTTKALDGTPTEGWFAEDFTLAEIKRLRAKQPLGFRASAWDGLHEVPTLREVIELAKRKSVELGRLVCIYPETKHPTYLADQGLDIDAALVAILDEHGYTEPTSPVFVQSFEVGNLKRLAGMTRVRLVQLMGEADARPYDFVKAGDPRTYQDLMAAPDGLRDIAAYAFGIGPWKRSIVGVDEGGNLRPPTTLVQDAHAAGLAVHPYTFRDEPRYLAKDYGDDPVAEYRQFFALGVDGVFSDFAHTAVRARSTADRRP